MDKSERVLGILRADSVEARFGVTRLIINMHPTDDG